MTRGDWWLVSGAALFLAGSCATVALVWLAATSYYAGPTTAEGWQRMERVWPFVAAAGGVALAGATTVAWVLAGRLDAWVKNRNRSAKSDPA